MEHLDQKEIQQLLSKHAPGIDEVIIEYVQGYLNDAAEAIATTGERDTDEDPIEDLVRPMLEDAGSSDAGVSTLCTKFSQMLTKVEQNSGAQKKASLAKLAAPVNMAAQMAQISKATKAAKGTTDLAHAKGRTVASQVDVKKLRKAEARIAAKLEKRGIKSRYEASKLINENPLDDDELLMKVNPVLDYTSTRDKVKDIKLDSFDISFSGKRILTNASLHMTYGRRYGLIGRNGIGKSTLLRNIAYRELSVPTYISILFVEQEMTGDDTTAIRSVLKADIFREQLLRDEAAINQELKSLDEPSPLDARGEVMSKHEIEARKNELGDQLNSIMSKLMDIESDKAEAKAGAILNGLGFNTEDFQRPTKSFSGGWRMRLSLARALFCRPDLLLLDEPTNMLDIPAVVWLEKYLRTWTSTLLVVSHDREFLDEVATDIIHQHSEKLDQYHGNFKAFWSTREERRKNQIREYESQMQYRAHLQDFIDRWRYNANRAAQAQMKIKILEKLPELEKPEDEKVVTFTFPNPEKISPPVMYMEDVTFGYTPEKKILEKVNIDMQMDTRVAIVGPNGAGKTTMLKLLIGKLDPTSGIVHRHGRLRIAYFSQHHVDQLDVTTTAVGHLRNMFPGNTDEEYRRHLGAFGISGMTGLQEIKTLSGGQKSRVTFAGLAVQQPHFLVLDEPTNHLDMESIDALTNALKQFTGGVVIVSHDERFIDSVCNQIWVCADRKVTKFAGESIKDYKKMICPDD
ncbi:ATP-binding cassette, regulator of translational elongation [Coemansia sp. RSA 989]|nr:P-loop containing nucleoside triphosphate hydrolase protein [Coemansia mojavensis]KAJ1738622.1 ATP-binding cassette, regulator of translational elongation [Coemansia sp. RSA 1086]KAJ1747103.1 ATP-binding cassette, regulator of translational elongation [Coemansia sp. RSA 1821]KAJ1862466.1 ATP-binding cassette, regulator of translational elongation [Coemansia sp. RSA 989]KAJ1869107.1 ATP-binding cassette, regulator of translational elongation [Coemansia sp. RSA 990]KAJ2648303.1 ATP-binding ca